MAVYRSDQALVTFAAEAAPGGYPELINATTRTDRTTLSGAHPAGSRSLLLASAASIAIGDYLTIGYTTGAGNAGEAESEIRRVVGKDGARVYLDSPTGFYHVTGEDVDEVDTSASPVIHATYPTALSNVSVYGNALKFIPGIYDTVDVPDMETAFNATYALGSSAKRNATFIYKGEQSFNGSIPAFTILNGWPLRFPFGRVSTLPSDITHEGAATQLYNASTQVSWRKGDMVIEIGAAIFDVAVVDSATAASNRNQLYIAHTYTYPDGSTLIKNEVVQIIELIDGETDHIARLANPLRFEHISSATDTFNAYLLDNTSRTYTHTITEESELDTISMNVHMRDSSETAANDFDRRYYGGRIGSAVIAGEETGLLTMSWDGIQFMGMNHNQQTDVNWSSTGSSAGNHYLPRFNFMKTITDSEAWVPSNSITNTLSQGVAGEPYLFSQGQITMFGNVIATIRSFSLTVNNNPEARYYIGGGGGGRNRGPYEIINQRREYSLSMTATEPVSRAASAAGGFNSDYETDPSVTDTATVQYHSGLGQSIFKEMLMEGDHGGVTGTSPEGLSFEIMLSRDGLTDSTSTDYIKIEPAYANSGTGPQFALSEQGVFIQSAKYNLDGSSPIQADLDILLRSVKITIGDSTPIYP